MPIDRFLIAPYNTGQQTNVRPWLIADDAFEYLHNAYVFRGRVRKRFGSLYMDGSTINQLLSRLRIQVASTDGVGAAAGNVPGTIFEVGQMFSIDGQLYTVISNIAGPQPMLNTGGGTATYDISNGAYSFTGATASDPVFFYPATPVMGLLSNPTSIIETYQLIAFDQQFAYQYTAGAFSRLGIAIWTGNDAQFFWGSPWANLITGQTDFWVTNFNIPDGIRYWDGTTWQSPALAIDNSGNSVLTARIIVQFGGHLIFLNTIEGTLGSPVSYPFRARWSAFSDATSADAWKAFINPTAGFRDATTPESITSAYFIKNRLIVFFASSTWELVYTGNEADPFIWQKINSELGAESTFSTIPFDKALLTIGDVGIHACNGANVERIDDKIPDTVFDIHNDNDGIFRVAGVRDYFVELAYWAFPDDQTEPSEYIPKFPNRVLVYNYKTGSWAFNDDTITAFGYFNNPSAALWGTDDQTWADSISLWGSGALASNFRQVTAGNQQGFVFLIYPDVSTNAPVMEITNIDISAQPMIFTVINHNLVQGDFVKVEHAVGLNHVNNLIYEVNVQDADTIRLFTPPAPAGTLPDPLPAPTGTYRGGGTLRRVTPIDIYTKQFNFYQQQGRNALIDKVDFLVDATSIGEFSVDFLPSFDLSGVGSFLSYEDPTNPAQVGASILETFPYTPANKPAIMGTEEGRESLWHSLYFNAEGQVVQMRFFMPRLQALKFVYDGSGNPQFVADEPFDLNAMMIYAQPTTSLFQ